MSDLQANLDVIEEIGMSGADGRFALVLLYRYVDTSGAYTEWLTSAMTTLAEAGGRVVWAANGGWPVVGSRQREWDVIAIVEYPTRQAFLDHIRSPAFVEVERIRATAMVASEIYACVPLIDALS